MTVTYHQNMNGFYDLLVSCIVALHFSLIQRRVGTIMKYVRNMKVT
jgi:hypothetical protein